MPSGVICSSNFPGVAKKGAPNSYRVVFVESLINLEPEIDFLVFFPYFLVEVYTIVPCEVVLGDALIPATVAAGFELIAVHGESPQVPSVLT